MSELHLRGFNNHRVTDVVLPASGIVLVTGDNGAGKSTLLEAEAWGRYGRTIRGTPPAPVEGSKETAVRLVGAPGAPTIERLRKGRSRPALSWSVPGVAPVVYETTTKAQEALEGVIGTFETWRRTSVFTSVDAWTFAEATDAQRKVLLEGLLGLGRLDAGMERCRADLRTARAEHAIAQREAAFAVEQEKEVQARATELRGVKPPDALENADALVLRNERVFASMQEIEAEMRTVRNGAADAARARDRAEHALTVAREAVARLEGYKECPTCTQPIGEQALATARAVALRAEQQAIALREQHRAAALVADQQLADLTGDHTALREQYDAAALTLRAAKQGAEARANWHRAANALTPKLLEASMRVASTAERATATALRVKHLEICDTVLGLKGLRAHLLGGSLAAVEAMANVWLARVSEGALALGLAVVDDKVTLSVRGAGGGHGYAAISAGERRRVAFALMLALAELAQASAEGPRGTLWFDEVFDGLDADGVMLVCGALEVLAKDRAVVVITHSPEVREHLPHVARFHVSSGSTQALALKA